MESDIYSENNRILIILLILYNTICLDNGVNVNALSFNQTYFRVWNLEIRII